MATTVNVTGTVRLADGSTPPIGSALWAVPEQPTSKGGLISDLPVQLTLSGASWSGSLYAYPDTGMRYRFELRTPELGKSRSWWLYGGRAFTIPTGGGPDIDWGDAPDLSQGLVYTSPTAPDAGVTAQYQLNTVTGDLHVRSA